MSMLRVVNLFNRYEYLLQARFYFHLDTAESEWSEKKTTVDERVSAMESFAHNADSGT